MLAWGGRIVFCGATSAPAAQVHLRALFFKNQSILGSTMGSLAELRHLLQFVESGALKPVIDRTVPLAEVPDAIAYVEEGHARGKVVITV